MPHSEISAFLKEKVPEIKKLSEESAIAYWNATTTGEPRYAEEYAQKREALLTLFSNRDDFALLKKWQEKTITDPAEKRQVQLLYNEYLPNQFSPEIIRELVALETEIESRFTSFRAQYQGESISNNAINDVLQKEQDNQKRKEAWEASKQIGGEVAELILSLVRLRNKTAKELGYSDYYTMSLQQQELDPEELFAVLNRLKQESDQPFRQVKEKLDAELAERFQVPANQLMPWHYSDPFFQETPPLRDVDLDAYFKEVDIEQTCIRFFSEIGLETEDILKRSDLYEREGKNQHAFCIDIDRAGDIRVLANIRNNEWWMGTMLHELGHGVYDKYIHHDLPFLLHTYPHILSTEAIAMLMGSLTKQPEWLARYSKMDENEANRLAKVLRDYLSLSMLIFVRWGLVMVYFERELYRNPDQDLNKLWWDLVGELQLVKKPDGRNQPDWASKIHIGTAPVYYQNYILGELMASQLYFTLQKVTGQPTFVGQKSAGTFLREQIFHQGSLYHWNDLLERSTGERLNPDYFIKRFVQSSGQ